MKWFWQKDLPPPSHDEELVEAQAQREDAERRLKESRIAARQVRQVSVTARQIRTDNQFSLRLEQAFGSRPQNG